MDREILNNLLVYHADRVTGEIQNGLKESEDLEQELLKYQDEIEWIKEKRGLLHDPKFVESSGLTTGEIHERLQRYERRENELYDLIEKTNLLTPEQVMELRERMVKLNESKDYIIEHLLDKKTTEEQIEMIREKRGFPRRPGKLRN